LALILFFVLFVGIYVLWVGKFGFLFDFGRDLYYDFFSK
jgi:hypothetical protein